MWLVQDTVTSSNPLGDSIVGAPSSSYQSPGTYVFGDMEFTYSGLDTMPQTIESDLVSMLTYMQVQAGPSGAIGSITITWNGVSPCGDVEYCAMPPTVGPTTSPTTYPTPSPTDAPTRNPTTDSPTRRPTLIPTTSRPTYEPSTSNPTFKPLYRPDPDIITTRAPTSCNMGDYEDRYERLSEELEDLTDKCDMKQAQREELQDVCRTSVPNYLCNQCFTKTQFTGTLPSPFTTLSGRVPALTLPVDLDTGYPDQTTFVSNNGEVYVYRPDLGTNIYQRTCVGAGLQAMSCDSSRVVCAGGNTYGTQEQVAAALKVSATSRIDKVHPNCPTGCQMMDGTMAQYFQNQDTDIDVNRICVYGDEYHYIEDDGTYTYTCVGYGLETEVCPSYKTTCVGFEETSGLPTYGWFGEQARAVKKALNEADNVYPTCPGSS